MLVAPLTPILNLYNSMISKSQSGSVIMDLRIWILLIMLNFILKAITKVKYYLTYIFYRSIYYPERII